MISRMFLFPERLLIAAAVFLFAITSTSFGQLTEETNEHQYGGPDSPVTKSHVYLRNEKPVLMSLEFKNTEGVPTKRQHFLQVAGVMVTILDDKGADNTLDGICVFDKKNDGMEYFYVTDGLKITPASDEEMEQASTVGNDVSSLVKEVIDGGEFTMAKLNAIRFKFWLSKWDLPMILIVAGAAFSAFQLGQRMERRRDRQVYQPLEDAS